MMVVAAGGVALANVLADPPSVERERSAQVSQAPSAVRPPSEPAFRAQARPSAPRLAYALPALPPPLEAAHSFDLVRDSRSVPSVSSPPRDSRGPPVPSIAHR